MFSPLHSISLWLSRIRLWGYLVNWVVRSFRLHNTELGLTALAALEGKAICSGHASVMFRYGNIPVGHATPFVFCFLSCVSVAYADRTSVAVTGPFLSDLLIKTTTIVCHERLFKVAHFPGHHHILDHNRDWIRSRHVSMTHCYVSMVIIPFWITTGTGLDPDMCQ